MKDLCPFLFGLMAIVAIISMCAILYKFSLTFEISRDAYYSLSCLSDSKPKIKPVIEKAMSDNVITLQEYFDIIEEADGKNMVKLKAKLSNQQVEKPCQ